MAADPFDVYRDPRKLQQLAFQQGLLGLATGLLRGRNWSEGLSTGLANYGQQSQNTLWDSVKAAQLAQEQAKGEREAAADAVKKKAIDELIAQQPPAEQPRWRAAAAAGALDTIIANQFKPPEAPKTREIRRGTQQVTQEWSPEKGWADVASGPAWGPQQGPAPSEFDRLAAAAGLRPGTPEYVAAAQQKLMGGNKTISSGGVSPEQFQAEEKIRDDFNQLPEVKSYKTVIPIIESAYETLGRDNHSSDINLIYALGKIMDPGSVVCEGEMVMATQAGSPASQVVGLMSYLTGGGKLPPDVRSQLVAELQSRTDALQSQYTQAYDRYSDMAKAYGLDVPRTIGAASQQRRAPKLADPLGIR
jgi:hypothetical protein